MHQRSHIINNTNSSNDDDDDGDENLQYIPNHLQSKNPKVVDLQYQYDSSSSKGTIRTYPSTIQNISFQNNNEILFTWANKDQILTKILIILQVIHFKQKNGNSRELRKTNKLKNKKKSTKSKSKDLSKLNSNLKSKSKSMSKSKSKSNSKLNNCKCKHNLISNNQQKLKQKQPSRRSRMKRLLEKLDKDSAQYKVLHWDTSKFRKISKIELSKHIIPSSAHITKIKISEKPDGIWMLIHGFIFDIVGLLEMHPGGAECLLDCAGVDATRVFDDVGHSDIAWEMLENCCVGIIEDFDDSDDSDTEEENENINENICESCNFHVKNHISNLDNPEEVVEEKDDDDDDDEEDSDEDEDEDDNDDNGDDDVDSAADIIGSYDDDLILVWNNKVVEYAGFVIFALLGLFCFIQLQRKKWDQWEDISASSKLQSKLHNETPVYGNQS